ncbi:hypothetical protein D3C80_1227340 [compost metagenome]
MLVPQNLDLDMARLVDELLDEDTVVAERVFRLVAGRLETLARFRVVPGDAHALAAAPCGCLDHHRIADRGRDFHRLVSVFDQAHVPGHGRDTGLRSDLFRGDLVAHCLDGLHGRADEGDTGFFECGGESGIFRQKAITRMHGIRTGPGDRIEYLVDDDIGLVGRCGTDMHRLVGHRHMQGIRIGVRIDGDGCDAHLLRCSDNPAGDFATIGDEDFLEHGCGPSERYRVVFFPMRRYLLVAQRGKGAGDTATGRMRHDHLVDETALGGNEGIGETFFVFLRAGRDLVRV